jgi:hypothetical protein
MSRLMRITVELRTEAVTQGNWMAVQPGQIATLSGGGWSVPVSIRAIHANSGDPDDKEAIGRLLGPGYVLDDDAEAWVAVMETYGGGFRVASSFLPLEHRDDSKPIVMTIWTRHNQL